MSLHCGDNLPILKSLPSESVDLVYLDPPFNSGRNYFQADKQAFTDAWQWSDESESLLDEVGLSVLVEFVGRNGLSAYLVMMAARLAELHRVLKPTGSFYLHCDPSSSHYLKLVLDSIFCPQGGDYKNEIIWWYETGGIPKKDFSRKHDVLLRYTKTKIYTFNAHEVLESRSDEVLRRIATGNFSATRSTGQFRHPSDVWKIPAINAMAKERLGYPTQKPEALLERIIKASSNPGDVVLDPFCGSGTTLAVAQKLGREWIGIDMNPDAIELVRQRLNQPLQLKLA